MGLFSKKPKEPEYDAVDCKCLFQLISQRMHTFPQT